MAPDRIPIRFRSAYTYWYSSRQLAGIAADGWADGEDTACSAGREGSFLLTPFTGRARFFALCRRLRRDFLAKTASPCVQVNSTNSGPAIPKRVRMAHILPLEANHPVPYPNYLSQSTPPPPSGKAPSRKTLRCQAPPPEGKHFPKELQLLGV